MTYIFGLLFSYHENPYHLYYHA